MATGGDLSFSDRDLGVLTVGERLSRAERRLRARGYQPGGAATPMATPEPQPAAPLDINPRSSTRTGTDSHGQAPVLNFEPRPVPLPTPTPEVVDRQRDRELRFLQAEEEARPKTEPKSAAAAFSPAPAQRHRFRGIGIAPPGETPAKPEAKKVDPAAAERVKTRDEREAQIEAAFETLRRRDRAETLLGGATNEVERGLAQADQTLSVLGILGGADTFEKLAKAQREIDAIPVSEAMQGIQEAESLGASVKAFARHPVATTSQIIGNSLAMFIPSAIPIVGGTVAAGAGVGAGAGSVIPGAGTGVGAAAGARGGFIAGTALNSLLIEYTAEAMAHLRQAGFDTTDPESLRQAFADPAVRAVLRERGLKRGIPIAVLDAVSAGIAGRIAGPVAKGFGKPLIGRAMGETAEMGAQAALGAGGEAAAQAVIGEGFHAGNILAEAIGEVGTGAAEVAVGRVLGGSQRPPTSPPGQPLELVPATSAAEAGQGAPLTPQTPPEVPRDTTAPPDVAGKPPAAAQEPGSALGTGIETPKAATGQETALPGQIQAGAKVQPAATTEGGEQVGQGNQEAEGGAQGRVLTPEQRREAYRRAHSGRTIEGVSPEADAAIRSKVPPPPGSTLDAGRDRVSELGLDPVNPVLSQFYGQRGGGMSPEESGYRVGLNPAIETASIEAALQDAGEAFDIARASFKAGNRQMAGTMSELATLRQFLGRALAVRSKGVEADDAPGGQFEKVILPALGLTRAEYDALRAPLRGEGAAAAAEIDPAQVAVLEVPLERITLSEDAPQFKEGAEKKTGVVKPLEGRYERTGTAPIVLWERTDGRLEVITGRHRLDLARRSGEKSIPSQIMREAEGFTVDDAKTFDAMSNIRDNQGEVRDYARFFRQATGLADEAAARASGLLSRAKGLAGWHIGKGGTDVLFEAFDNRAVGERAAVAIARTAPGDERLQLAGLTYAQGAKKPSPEEVRAYMQALATGAGHFTSAEVESQPDIFGSATDAEVRNWAAEAEKMAKAAAEAQREIRDRIAAGQGAAKRPEQARALGIDVSDPGAVQKQIDAMRAELARWDEFEKHADLVAAARERAGLEPAPAVDEDDVDDTGTEGLEGDIFKERQAKLGKQPPRAQQGDLFPPSAEQTGFATPSADAKVGKSDAPKDTPDMFDAESLRAESRESLRTMARERGIDVEGKGKQSLIESLTEARMPSVTPNLPTVATEGERITARSIIEFAEQAFDVPIRGKATHRMGQTVGWFQVKPQLIRLAQHNDLETAAHEIAHKLERTIWGRRRAANAAWKPYQKELADMDYDQGARRMHEGFAEYLRLWLMGARHEINQTAPGFDKFFRETVLPAHPETQASLTELHKLYGRWMEQGAKERILSQIEDSTRGRREMSFTERAGAVLRRLRSWFIDDLVTMDRALRESDIRPGDLAPSEDPLEQARAWKEKASGMAAEMVLDRTRDLAGNVTGPGLKQVLQPVADRIEDFMAYAFARRARVLIRRGMNPGILSRDAEAIIAQFDAAPGFKDAVDGLTEWSDRLMDILVEAGGLSAEARQLIRDLNPVYIPLMRVFVDELGASGGGTGRGLVNTGSPIKKQHGSGRAIQHPLHSLAQYAERVLSAANKMRVARALGDLATRNKIKSKWIVEVPLPLEIKQIATQRILEKMIPELAGQMQAHGIDKTALDDIITNMLLRLPEAMTFFDKSTQLPKGSKGNIVSIWKEGELRMFELHPDLFRTLTNMDTFQLPRFLDLVIGAPTRLLRLGATGVQAGFTLSNLMRDSMTALVTGRHAKTGPLASAWGLWAEVERAIGDDTSRADMARLFRASGGQLGGYVGQDVRAMRNIRKRMLIHTPRQRAVYTLRHPLETLREILAIGEMAPRVAEFSAAYKAGEAKYGAKSEDALIAAVNAAQDVTINFTRKGDIGRVINTFSAFWNASVQGLDKMQRSLRENPVGTSFRALAGLTLPTLLLWWRNRDEEWYRERAAWEKATFWMMSFDGGETIFRIPKPFDWGFVFATMPEAALDARYNEDPGLFADVGKASAEMLIPEANPLKIVTATRPLVEVATNKNFAGTPIVPPRLKDLPPEQQFHPHTPRLWRALGDVLGVSPLEAEHLAAGYTGGVARKIPQQAELAADVAGGKAIDRADLPIVGRFFTRGPERAARSTERFYKRIEELTIKSNGDKSTLEEEAELMILERTARDLGDMRKELREAQEAGDRVTETAINMAMGETLRVALGRQPTERDVSVVMERQADREFSDSIPREARGLVSARSRLAELDERRTRDENRDYNRLGNFYGYYLQQRERIKSAESRGQTERAARLREAMRERAEETRAGLRGDY